MLYAYPGNAAQEIPLTSATYQGLVSTLISASVATAGAIATGGATGAAMIATGGANSLAHEMVHYGRTGSLQANVGIMGNRYPQIIISNRNRADAANYAQIYGYPSNKSVYLGNLSGYTRVKAIELGTFATQPERDELTTLLKGGVIF